MPNNCHRSTVIFSLADHSKRQLNRSGGSDFWDAEICESNSTFEHNCPHQEDRIVEALTINDCSSDYSENALLTHWHSWQWV